MTLLLLSLLALASGPLCYRLADRVRLSLATLDGFVMVTVGGLALVHIIPHAFSSAGVWAAVVAGLGFFAPGFLEHQLARAAKRTHAVTLVLAIGGLILHEFFDGVGLSAPLDLDESHFLALAVVLHRLPLSITIWWLLAPTYGWRVATLVLAGLAVSTVAGYGSAGSMNEYLEGPFLGFLEALIAGSLLHVVVHRTSPLVAGISKKNAAFFAGIGALVGVALIYILSMERDALHEHHASEFTSIFLNLALQSAPSLLLAFAILGVMQFTLPQASLSWLHRGGSALQAVKGMLFGLRQPICSCGVVPMYRRLVSSGVPLTAAVSFLIATPGLGVDSLLITIPLLGKEFAVVRLVAAALIAVMVALVIGARITRVAPSSQSAVVDALSKPLSSQFYSGIRFGFGQMVDHTGPWLVLGLVVAALAESLISPAWIAVLPFGSDVVLLALIGLPMYLCASAATPVVAILIAKGISPGAGLAFLLAGPATNITTFSMLAALHSRKVALGFGVAILGITVCIGLAVSHFVSIPVGPLEVEHVEHAGWFATSCLVLLSFALVLSILRQGPRGFVEQVLMPYGGSGHSHDHDHDHAHAHSHDDAHLHEHSHDDEHLHDHDHSHGQDHLHEQDGSRGDARVPHDLKNNK